MTTPKKLSFNPIQEADGQPTLADDLEWNFDELEDFSSDTVDSINDLNDSINPVIPLVVLGHYEEVFTATDSHLVTHNLGGYPQVTVFNSSDRKIHTVVDYVDNNSITLRFVGTLTGATVAVDTGTIV